MGAMLTLKQEREIIEYLQSHMDDLFIASGSSRAVFSIDDVIVSMLELYGVNLPTAAVIKMSLGLGGYRQSCREFDMFYDMRNAEKYLANIYARGSVLTIMESVDVDWDFLEFYDCYYLEVKEYMEIFDDDEDSDEYRQNYEIYSAAAETMNALENYLGTTSDNAQVGRAEDGRFVAYDYGFDTGLYASDQMTRTSHYFSYGEEETDAFFELLLSSLDEVISLGLEVMAEEDFARIEDNYCDLVQVSNED